MKKVLASLALTFVMASTALAQGLSIRAEGGAIFGSSSNIALPGAGGSSTNLEFKDNTGLRLGAALEFKFFGFFYFSPGLTYNVATSNLTAASVLSGKKVSLTDHNLSLPLNLGFRIKPLGLLGVSVEAGPYASYQLSNKGIVDGKEIDTSEIFKDVQGFDFNKLNYGLNASAAVEFSAFYVRGGVLLPLSDKFKNDPFGEAGKGFEKVWNEIKDKGLNSKSLSYFVTLGIRF